MISPLFYFLFFFFSANNFRTQARTRMEKQIFLRIAFGIVLKEVFTSKCNESDNLNRNFPLSSAMRAADKTKNSARIFVPRGQESFKKSHWQQ